MNLNLSKLNIKQEEYLLKLKIIGQFDADELNKLYLNKFNIFCKYEDMCLHINHLAFIEYSNNQQSLYIPFMYNKFLVKLHLK